MKLTNLTSLSLLLLVLIGLSGCATLPTPDEMQSDIQGYNLPKLPKSGNAIVYIVRPSSLGGLINFKVYVDEKIPEQKKGSTKGGQYIYFELEPGDHQIISQAENKAYVNVTVQAGDIVFIHQEPVPGILFAQNKVFKLHDYEGKYHVKHLKLGRLINSE